MEGCSVERRRRAASCQLEVAQSPTKRVVVRCRADIDPLRSAPLQSAPLSPAASHRGLKFHHSAPPTYVAPGPHVALRRLYEYWDVPILAGQVYVGAFHSNKGHEMALAATKHRMGGRLHAYEREYCKDKTLCSDNAFHRDREVDRGAGVEGDLLSAFLRSR